MPSQEIGLEHQTKSQISLKLPHKMLRLLTYSYPLHSALTDLQHFCGYGIYTVQRTLFSGCGLEVVRPKVLPSGLGQIWVLLQVLISTVSMTV